MDLQMVGCWDSVLLENESENCFISNLNLRFKRDNIYVRKIRKRFAWGRRVKSEVEEVERRRQKGEAGVQQQISRGTVTCANIVCINI
jgi:hypothetical protein